MAVDHTNGTTGNGNGINVPLLGTSSNSSGVASINSGNGDIASAMDIAINDDMTSYDASRHVRNVHDSHTWLYQQLLTLLECPVCYLPITGRILQCSEGHTLCSSCYYRVSHQCPVCRVAISGTRNPPSNGVHAAHGHVHGNGGNGNGNGSGGMAAAMMAPSVAAALGVSTTTPTNSGHNNGAIRCLSLEKLTSLLYVTCSFASSGCSAQLRWNDRALHESLCIFRDLPCIASLMSSRFADCMWAGPLHQCIAHVTSAHRNSIDKPGLFDRSSLPLQEGNQQTLAKLLLKRPGGWTYFFGLHTTTPIHTSSSSAATTPRGKLFDSTSFQSDTSTTTTNIPASVPAIATAAIPSSSSSLSLSLHESISLVVRIDSMTMVSGIRISVIACVLPSLASRIRYRLTFRIIPAIDDTPVPAAAVAVAAIPSSTSSTSVGASIPFPTIAAAPIVTSSTPTSLQSSTRLSFPLSSTSSITGVTSTSSIPIDSSSIPPALSSSSTSMSGGIDPNMTACIHGTAVALCYAPDRTRRKGIKLYLPSHSQVHDKMLEIVGIFWVTPEVVPPPSSSSSSSSSCVPSIGSLSSLSLSHHHRSGSSSSSDSIATTPVGSAASSSNQWPNILVDNPLLGSDSDVE